MTYPSTYTASATSPKMTTAVVPSWVVGILNQTTLTKNAYQDAFLCMMARDSRSIVQKAKIRRAYAWAWVVWLGGMASIGFSPVVSGLCMLYMYVTIITAMRLSDHVRIFQAYADEWERARVKPYHPTFLRESDFPIPFPPAPSSEMMVS